MDNQLAPIALFCYTRLDHLKQTVEALQKNDLASESELFVFSDAAKNEKSKEAVEGVRQYIQTIKGFKRVTINEAPTNKGLAQSITQGVSKVVYQFDKIVVLEDDLITTPNFLTYMNQALEYYKKVEKVWSVSGCNFPFEMPENYKNDVYFFPRACSWGWATWKNRWDKAQWKLTGKEDIFHSIKIQRKFNQGGDDMYALLKQAFKGEVSSWAIVWDYYQMQNGMLTVWPVKSKVQNIGLDGTGHHGDNKTINFIMDSGKHTTKFINDIEINEQILRNRLRYINGNTFKRIKIWIKRILMNCLKSIKNVN